MAVAWNENAVGHAQSDVIIRDEIDLYLAMPRFLAPNDTAYIPAIVRNVEAKDGEYTLKVTSPTGTSEKKLTLNKGTEARVPFKQQFADSGVKTIQADLSGNQVNFARKYQIAVRQGIQVVAIQQYGILEPKQTLTLDAALLKDFQPKNSEVVLSVGAAPDLGRVQLIKELKGYPYYCLEQTTSRLLGFAASCTDNAQCAQDLNKGFNQLASLQKIDGSYALWSLDGTTQGWLTIYATDILHFVKQKGYTVPEALWANSLKWVTEAQNRSINRKGDVSIMAYAHYVLAKNKQGSLSLLRFFADNANNQIVLKSDMAFIGAAFAYYGDAKQAAVWFDKAINAPENNPEDYEVRFGSELRDSTILVTLLAETTQNHPKLLALANDLVNKSKGVRYLNTQEKAWLIRASLALKSLQKDYQFTLNQKTIQGQEPFRASFNVDKLKSAQQIVNTAQSPLFYSLTLVGEPTDVKVLTQDGFEIKREIYTPSGDLVSPLNFKSGDLYMVVIKGQRTKANLHHVILVDMLPAGFEIENAKLTDEIIAQNFSWLGSLTQASRIEGRDDRFVAAYELGQQSQINAAYLVRAVTSGSFQYPPVYIESMYQPQYFKYGEAQTIQVESELVKQ
jgi:uncharacterized protein YfaS (alpha-2-macroglobulin family)